MARLIFVAPDGLRLAIDPETVKAIVEVDETRVTLITDDDCYAVRCSFDEADGLIWPPAPASLADDGLPL